MKKVLQWIGLALMLGGLVYMLLLQREVTPFAALAQPTIFALLLVAGAGAMLFGELLDKLLRTEQRVQALEDAVRRLGGDLPADGKARADADKDHHSHN